MQEIKLGLAGFGTVGAGVYRHLRDSRALLAERVGAHFSVERIVVRDLRKPRAIEAPSALFSDRLEDLLEDDSLQVIAELIGGTTTAFDFSMEVIKQGKILVTANKALLAEHGAEIFEAARAARTPVFYEAAVAGGIPIIKVIRESFVVNHFARIDGIINGTSNYILSRMDETGMDFEAALQEAQQEGYAEADPTFDINGWDAAHKAIILASLAYGFWLPSDQVRVEGIENVTAEDIRFAREFGYVIKLMATIRIDAEGAIEVRVCPSLTPKSHVLASVNGVFNAVSVQGDVVGESLFYGRGAGQDPTTSSVIADLAEASAALQGHQRCYGFTPHGLYGKTKLADDVVSQYYLRLTVGDRPGVLAQVAGILGTSNIGISSVIQPESHESGPVPLVLMLHDAPFGTTKAALAEIAKLECVKAEPTLFNVETFQ